MNTTSATEAPRVCPWLLRTFEQLDKARSDGHLGHAWLISGPKGIGKGGLVRALAARLLAPGCPAPLPLEARSAGVAALSGDEAVEHHADLHFLSPPADKKSISVEQVRESVSVLELTSLGGVGKVLIVEPAEAMTLSAANALLKTLEEPSPSTYFLLVSHQPGYLPATVRSRCQLLTAARPDWETALNWLANAADAIEPAAVAGLLSLAGGAPLRALTLFQSGHINLNKELSDTLHHIYENRLDPQDVAEQWHKGESELYLSWLALRLEGAIKARLAPEAWTSVTDLAGDALHNTWDGLTLKALFERLRDTRSLLGQLGTGINAELALRVLLLGFQAGRIEH